MILIRETARTENGFVVEVEINRVRFSDIALTPPFGEDAPLKEARLEWYFEEWLRFPILDAPRAQDAANSIPEYGSNLFTQLFGTPKAFSAFNTWFTQKSPDQRIEIIGSSAFHGLHWEAIKDPDRDFPLATQFPVIRTSPNAAADRIVIDREAPVIRVLLVTARPNGERDVGYRTISRPLLDALRNSQTKVQVDLLRPGTFEALSKHLEATQNTPYHVVHFDVHGSLMSFDRAQSALCHEGSGDGLTMRYGRGDLRTFTGEEGFLVFEPQERPQKKGDPTCDLARADEVAALLTRYNVPIAILNACQSGRQGNDDLGASLGARLLEKGVQNVLAMGYTVTVTAAEKMMPVLYEALFSEGHDGKTLPMSEAVRRARLELKNDRKRQAHFAQTIDLEDWILPIHYQREDARLTPRPMYQQEESAWLERQAQFTEEPQTATGPFLGRDVDTLRIERRLIDHNALLIYGGGGTGKTTFLKHLAAWWERTGWVETSHYFGYDQRAWTLQQILADLAKVILPLHEQGNFSVLSLAAQKMKIVGALRSHKHLLILDNLESVTAEAFAIRNDLPEEERAQIREFLEKLINGKTLVLLGSRGPVHWLETGVTRAGPARADEDMDYLLQGLDDAAASALTARILTRANARPDMDSDAMKMLLRLLAGHPLALEVILPNLRNQTPEEVLSGLTGGEKIDLAAGTEDRTRSIMACVDYSFSNLEPDLRSLLDCLAPFRSAVHRPALSRYVEALKAEPALSSLAFERIDEMLSAARTLGLLQPHGDQAARQMGYLTIQPTLPWFLAQRLARPERSEERTAIERAFRTHANSLGGAFLELIERKEADQRQLGFYLVGLEFDSLSNALEAALKAHEPLNMLYEPLRAFLSAAQQHNEAARLAKRVIDGLDAYPAERLSEAVLHDKIMISGNAATTLLELRQFDEAERGYLGVLTAIDTLPEPASEQAEKWRAVTHHQLGSVAQLRRDFDAAENALKKALEICVRFKDEHSAASTYHQLGIIAEERRDFDTAENAFNKALEIFLRFKDDYEAARTYGQLGRVAGERRDFDTAENAYKKALEIFMRFKDEHSAAITYHNLGMVAQERRDFDAAEDALKKALEIYVRFKDEHSAASTYHQLGVVALACRDFDAAENACKKALEIFLRFKDEHSTASTYHNLGSVSQERRDFDAAENAYKKALAIYVRLKDEHSAARTYHQLGIVAQERREFDAAENAYKKALEIKIRCNDEDFAASTYHQLGRVAQERRDFDAAENAYNKALEIFLRFKDDYEAAGTYHQLGRVAQERRDFDAAENAYRKALEIYVRLKDQHHVAITVRNIALLSKATPERRDHLIALISEMTGMTTEEVLAIFEQV